MPIDDKPIPLPPKPGGVYRVVHTADWHLGKPLGDLSREDEHGCFLDFLLASIREQEADQLVVAGDVFDSANPPQSAQRQYYTFLSSLFRETQCHVLIVGGNHDSPAQLAAPSRALEALRVKVIGSASEPGLEAITLFPDRSNPQLAVAAIPFLRDRDLRTASSSGSAESIQKAVTDGIARHYAKAAAAVEEPATSGIPAIATGHLTVTGSSTSDSEREIHIGGLGSVGTSVFPEVFQYVALGHLHRPQRCDGRDEVRYSGSPIPLSFSEASDHKELRVIDFHKDKLAGQHTLPLPLARALVQIRCKRTEIAEKIAKLEAPACELTPWVELVVEDALGGEDVLSTASEAAEGKPFEIVRVISSSAAELHGLSLGDTEITPDEADDLLADPARVFGLRLDGEDSLEADERDRLEAAFHGLLENLQGGEAGK